jgi:hypothetical protein
MKAFTIAVAIIFILSGCANTRDQPLYEYSKFDRSITVLGIEKHENPFFGTKLWWSIHSVVNKQNMRVTHYARVVLRYDAPSWRYYNIADDDQAKELATSNVTGNVDLCSEFGCFYEETVIIDLDEDELKRHIKSGYDIRISAKNAGQSLITLTPDMIESQFRALRDLFLSIHEVISKKS